MKKSVFFQIALTTLGASALLITASCGVKGPPLPPVPAAAELSDTKKMIRPSPSPSPSPMPQSTAKKKKGHR